MNTEEWGVFSFFSSLRVGLFLPHSSSLFLYLYSNLLVEQSRLVFMNYLCCMFAQLLYPCPFAVFFRLSGELESTFNDSCCSLDQVFLLDCKLTAMMTLSEMDLRVLLKFFRLMTMGTWMTASSSRWVSTSQLSLKIPFFMPSRGTQMIPSPYCAPPRQLPLQQLPSAQYISPYPYLLSFLQLPLNTLPPPHVKIPYPSFLSSMYQPSYLSLMSPRVFLQTPAPCRFPFLNQPLQQQPSIQQYSPKPYGFPLQNYPLQISPFEYRYNPDPCFKHCLNSPSQRSPFTQTWTPNPSALPNFHYPTQLSPFSPCHVPIPCFCPLSHSPQYNQPFGQVYLPTPSGFPFTQFPQNTHPFSKHQYPSPFLQSPAHPPSQTLPFEYIIIPKPCLFPFIIYPQQVYEYCLYALSLRQGEERSLSISMRSDCG